MGNNNFEIKKKKKSQNRKKKRVNKASSINKRNIQILRNFNADDSMLIDDIIRYSALLVNKRTTQRHFVYYDSYCIYFIVFSNPF